MKWNSLPTSAIYAPVRKQNFQVGCIHSEPKGLLVKNLVFYSQTLVPFYVGESASPGKSDYFRRSSEKHNQSGQEGLLQ